VTEAEAIKFLQSQKRFMLGQGEFSLSKAIATIRRSSLSMLGSGSLVLSSAAILAASNHSKVQSGSSPFIEITFLVLGSLVIGFSIWSLVRLHQACKALNHATDGSSRLSGSK
jgi:hypothetical protein